MRACALIGMEGHNLASCVWGEGAGADSYPTIFVVAPSESGEENVSLEKRSPKEPDADGVHLIGLAHLTDMDDETSSLGIGDEGLHDHE